jgi:putative sterol carrier protein
MTTIQRPPSDITPKDFFESFLPREYERLKPSGGPTPPDIKVQVQLDGAGGGTWVLALKGGALTVSAQAIPDADITVTQSVDDWRVITVGVANGPELTLPAGVSIESLLNVPPAIQQTLATTKGSLRIEIPGFLGRTFGLGITFHGAAQPAATLSVDAETLAQIRSGALPAPQAFFAGKILLSGDTAFAMQLIMTIMAQAQAQR